MDSVISMSITSVATVISGAILYFMKRFLGEQHDIEVRRESAKSKESALILRSLNALGKLTVANSIALRDGKTNGDMANALKEYESVEKELYEYLVESCTDSI